MNQQLINFTEQAEPNLALYAMIRGAKNYELTNHLGNVLTTISDKKIAVCTNGVFSHYMADVLTATDYSAFGAPLPQRVFNYKENLNKVLVTQNQFNTATELNDWTATNGTRTFTNNSLQYSTTNSTASVSRNFATQTSKTYRLTFTIDVGTAGTTSLAVLGYNGAAIVNGNIGQSGMQQLDFVANSTTTTLRLTINTGSGTRTLYLDNVKLEEVNGDLGGYRFGFNGMPKDDEMSGDGNSYDYGARIYNSRLGKWISVDPLENLYPYMSPYAYVANSPISLADPDGKRIIIYWKKNFWGKPVMHITVSGVVINSTRKVLPDFEVRNASLEIRQNLESHYNKDYGSFKVKIHYKMKVGTMSDATPDDHVIHLTNKTDLIDAYGRQMQGYTNAIGGKVMWLNYTDFWYNLDIPTPAHEFGHWLGLLHPWEYKPSTLFQKSVMDYPPQGQRPFHLVYQQQMLIASYFYFNGQLNRLSNASNYSYFKSIPDDPHNYQNIDFDRAIQDIGNFLNAVGNVIGNLIDSVFGTKDSSPPHLSPRYL
jgi:RHS repeat-associated protein